MGSTDPAILRLLQDVVASAPRMPAVQFNQMFNSQVQDTLALALALAPALALALSLAPALSLTLTLTLTPTLTLPTRRCRTCWWSSTSRTSHAHSSLSPRSCSRWHSPAAARNEGAGAGIRVGSPRAVTALRLSLVKRWGVCSGRGVALY